MNNYKVRFFDPKTEAFIKVEIVQASSIERACEIAQENNEELIWRDAYGVPNQLESTLKE